MSFRQCSGIIVRKFRGVLCFLVKHTRLFISIFPLVPYLTLDDTISLTVPVRILLVEIGASRGADRAEIIDSDSADRK